MQYILNFETTDKEDQGVTTEKIINGECDCQAGNCTCGKGNTDVELVETSEASIAGTCTCNSQPCNCGVIK